MTFEQEHENLLILRRKLDQAFFSNGFPFFDIMNMHRNCGLSSIDMLIMNYEADKSSTPEVIRNFIISLVFLV